MECKKLDPAEKSRTYIWPNGFRDTLENVVAFCARPSGTHRLETADGKKHVVATGWCRVEIDVEAWTL